MPLLENDQGGGSGEEDHLFFIRENPSIHGAEQIWFKRVNQYRISKLSASRASFEVNLVPREDGFPIGSQVDDLEQFYEVSAHIPLKNYWMNGRDTYDVQVEVFRLTLYINGVSKIYEYRDAEKLSPVKVYKDVLWGYIAPTRKFVFGYGK